MQYRSANTLPRDLSLFRADDGQVYLAGVPSPEVLKLRGKAVATSGKFNVGKNGRIFSLPKKNDGICEIAADLDVKKDGNVDLTLSNADGEKVTISYDGSVLKFDRMHGTFTDISHHFQSVTEAPVFVKDGKISLRIFVDHGSVEVFSADGKSVMTNLTFPENPYTKLTVSGNSATVENLKIYELIIK